MYERFTDRARKVMQLANQEAQRFNHEYIGTEHVLLGLIKEGSGVAANVLKNLDVDLRKIRLEVEKLVQSGPDMVTMGKLPQTPRAKKVIEYSMEEARNLNHNYVGTEHILLGLLREQEGVAAQVLMNLGLKLEEVREEVLNLLGHGLEGAESRTRWPRRRWRRRRRERRRPQEPQQDAGPRQLRPRSHRARPPEEARPGDRPRERNRTGDPNPQPPHEEQPGAARRSGRRQDGHRRRLRPARDRRQRARAAAGPPHRRARPGDDGRRHEVPRPVRRADQGGDERSPPREEHDPVHRRAAHAGRRRRCGRGDRRLERAQAGPGPRRNPVHRRHDARRVPQVHREGFGPGSPVPGSAHRADDARGHGPDPPRPARSVRRASPRANHRRRDPGGRRAVGPLHHGPLPAGQGDRRDRRSRRPRAAQEHVEAAESEGDRRRSRSASTARRKRRSPTRTSSRRPASAIRPTSSRRRSSRSPRNGARNRARTAASSTKTSSPKSSRR